MGRQVAINRELHYTIELWEDEHGEMWCVLRNEKLSLIKGEYHPIGKLFTFPKRWGLKVGAQKLLEYKIGDYQRMISDAQQNIEKLNRTRVIVDDWKE